MKKLLMEYASYQSSQEERVDAIIATRSQLTENIRKMMAEQKRLAKAARKGKAVLSLDPPLPSPKDSTDGLITISPVNFNPLIQGSTLT